MNTVKPEENMTGISQNLLRFRLRSEIFYHMNVRAEFIYEYFIGILVKFDGFIETFLILLGVEFEREVDKMINNMLNILEE